MPVFPGYSINPICDLWLVKIWFGRFASDVFVSLSQIVALAVVRRILDEPIFRDSMNYSKKTRIRE